ncbi:MAG: glycosyltransferase family 4 protein [Elusimicrobiota bacterium]|nr:glycosyltransferase family 4 protein [Elusimicrobiota bacterium]
MIEEKKICVHIVTTLELGGAQQNTLFTVANMMDFHGVLITGCEGITEPSGLEVHRVKNLVREINFFKDTAAFFSLYFLLRKIRPEIVHTHSSKAGILGRWAAFFARVPVVIHTFHGFGFNDRQKVSVKKKYIRAEQMTAKISTALFAVSEKNVEKALSLGICPEDKISVVHSGIDMKRWEGRLSREAAKKGFGIAANVPVVGMAACFKEQKAPLDFIEIACRVKKLNPHAKFIIVGDGILRGEIEKRIYKYRLGDDVTLAGWRPDIENVLPAFDINVLTSLWEGLPRVSLEAGVCLIPQVLSNVDGAPEIIEDGVTGYLVEPHDIDTFVSRIDHLIKNPDDGRVFAHKLRKKLTGDFDIRGMVRLIEQKYSEIAKSKS